MNNDNATGGTRPTTAADTKGDKDVTVTSEGAGHQADAGERGLRRAGPGVGTDARTGVGAGVGTGVGTGAGTAPRPLDVTSTAREVQLLAVGGVTCPDGVHWLVKHLAAIPGVRTVVADFGSIAVTPVLVMYAEATQPARALAKSAIRAEVLRCGHTIRNVGRIGDRPT